MKSRYSAYSFGLVKYIIKTTHNENIEYSLDTNSWGKEIKEFSLNTDFLGLKILDFTDGKDIAFVTFEATLYSKQNDISFKERSKFYKLSDMWFYHSGEFL